MKKDLFAIILLSVILISCRENSVSKPAENYKSALEYPIKEIPLTGKAYERDTEISGMAWHGDNLILLPQYPHRLSDNEFGILYSIPKIKILSLLKGEINTITPDEIKFYSDGFQEYEGFGSGYEAIAFDGDTAFISIEYTSAAKMSSIICRGIFNSGNNSITLDSKKKMQIDSQTDIINLSYEAIALTTANILCFYEANGKNVNPAPKVFSVSRDLTSAEKINFPNIEYRITDATYIDSNGNFWISNYYYPGDESDLLPADDSLFLQFGIGESYKKNNSVERLVEMNFSSGKLNFSGKPPILIKLEENNESRNCEGIARLDSLGFLLVTDVYPRTIFAFVKYPN